MLKNYVVDLVCDNYVFLTCFGGSPSREAAKTGNIYKKTNIFVD
jgi:hypothetical protein